MTDYTRSTPETYWYLLNYRGDITGMVDKNGVKVVEYTYDNFGNILSATGTVTTGDGLLLHEANPFRYAGYQFDVETGFYYLKASYYSPYLGRFLTRDPIYQNNLYTYGSNNPVNKVDPYGLIADRLNTYDNHGYDGDIIQAFVTISYIGLA